MQMTAELAPRYGNDCASVKFLTFMFQTRCAEDITPKVMGIIRMLWLFSTKSRREVFQFSFHSGAQVVLLARTQNQVGPSIHLLFLERIM